MRSVHIEKKIRDKINDWLSSIDDVQLAADLRKGVIVTGGAIVSMLLDEKVNDYDVYLRTKELAERVARYYVDKMQDYALRLVRYGYTEGAESAKVITRSDGRVMIVVRSVGFAAAQEEDDEEEEEREEEKHESEQPWARMPTLESAHDADEGYRYFEMISDTAEREAAIEGFLVGALKLDAEEESDEQETTELPRYRPVFMTSNAITLSDGIQIVIRFYGKPSEIHANYDFEHCKSYWRSWAKTGSQLTILKSALLCIVNKRLKYTGSRYPICSLFRLRKFQARGWTYDLGQVLKIAMQVGDLDLHNPEVLMDQLIGMDVAYFLEIIYRIRDEGIESVDSTYLARLVDEVYGEF